MIIDNGGLNREVVQGFLSQFSTSCDNSAHSEFSTVERIQYQRNSLDKSGAECTSLDRKRCTNFSNLFLLIESPFRQDTQTSQILAIRSSYEL
jgi:hypothetical protein